MSCAPHGISPLRAARVLSSLFQGSERRPRGCSFRKLRFVLGGATGHSRVADNASGGCVRVLRRSMLLESRAHAHPTDFASAEGRRVPSSSSSSSSRFSDVSSRKLPIDNFIAAFGWPLRQVFAFRVENSRLSFFSLFSPSSARYDSRRSLFAERETRRRTRAKGPIHRRTSITSCAFCRRSRDHQLARYASAIFEIDARHLRPRSKCPR